MFSLIITIVSIVLATALAVSTVYYGGIAFNQASANATVGELLNHSQQISAANLVYAQLNGGQLAAAHGATGNPLVTAGTIRTWPQVSSKINPSAEYGVNVLNHVLIRLNGISTSAALRLCEAMERKAGRTYSDIDSEIDELDPDAMYFLELSTGRTSTELDPSGSFQVAGAHKYGCVRKSSYLTLYYKG